MAEDRADLTTQAAQRAHVRIHHAGPHAMQIQSRAAPPSDSEDPSMPPKPGDGATTASAGPTDTATSVGSSPVVVFVPGLGLNGTSWQAVREELSGRSRVVLLPSMGRPASRRMRLGVQAQAERLMQTLPTGTPTILVGHSASCPVAVEVATRSRDIVGLVLVGPVTDPRANTWPRMLSKWVRAASQEPPSLARVLGPQYQRTGAMSMLMGINSVRRFRTDLGLRGLTLPVEIVRGQKDWIASHRWSTELSGASNGRLTTVPSGAHMVPLTHPAAIAAAVERVRLLSGQTQQAAGA